MTELSVVDTTTTQNNSTSQKSSRELIFRTREYCSLTSRDFYETIQTRSHAVSLLYHLQGATRGNCANTCSEKCSHVQCTDDFTLGADGYTCRCKRGQQSLCKTNAICNTANNKEVCECREGYEGNGTVQCTNINECARNICGNNAIGCTDDNPGYTCSCAAGYTYTYVYNTGCVDINECNISSPCGSNAACTNIPGNFTCKCNPGYEGNPPNTGCGDIDECALVPNRCGSNGNCQNLDGTFRCNCNTGFSWPNINSQCVDNDECTNPNLCNRVTERCRNTGGGFVCDCAPGYGGASRNCVDVNECLQVPAFCGPNSRCTNSIGNVTCQCDAAFPGGNPPVESCRKLRTGEVCPNPSSSSLCDNGLECAIKSRSEQDVFTCCANPIRCNVNQLCCEGSYDEGERCPSGANSDCANGLQCVRGGLIFGARVCCRSVFNLFGIVFCLSS